MEINRSGRFTCEHLHAYTFLLLFAIWKKIRRKKNEKQHKEEQKKRETIRKDQIDHKKPSTMMTIEANELSVLLDFVVLWPRLPNTCLKLLRMSGHQIQTEKKTTPTNGRKNSTNMRNEHS